LGASESRVIEAAMPGAEQKTPAGVQVDERDLEVGEPLDRVEAQVATRPKDDDAAKWACRARVVAPAVLAAESVASLQPAVLDGEADLGAGCGFAAATSQSDSRGLLELSQGAWRLPRGLLRTSPKLALLEPLAMARRIANE
jgi:hypothetical protein